jgi:hypothetical protein
MWLASIDFELVKARAVQLPNCAIHDIWDPSSARSDSSVLQISVDQLLLLARTDDRRMDTSLAGDLQ